MTNRSQSLAACGWGFRIVPHRFGATYIGDTQKFFLLSNFSKGIEAIQGKKFIRPDWRKSGIFYPQNSFHPIFFPEKNSARKKSRIFTRTAPPGNFAAR